MDPTDRAPITALVLLNPRARGGRGARRWGRVAGALAGELSPSVVELDEAGAWEGSVRAALGEGIRDFVAAGGDGTVSALVDCLYRAPSRPALAALRLGAVGLGSSNDFHKPGLRRVAGVPVRLRRSPGALRDVCLARYLDREGALRERCFVVSASLGLTAEGNARFNRRAGLLAWLTAGSTSLGIAATALVTLLSHHPRQLRLTLGAETHALSVMSLNAQKTPWVSGALRLDTPAADDDGRLGVNVCTATSRAGELRALFDLTRGRFLRGPDRRFWSVPSVRIEADELFDLELDGEVVTATAVELRVTGERIGALR